MRYISDNQLADIGFTRANYVDGIKAQILEELNAEDAKVSYEAPLRSGLQVPA